MIAIASFRWSDHSDAEITLDRPTCTRSIVRAPFSPPADCFIPQNDRRSSVPSTRRLTVECISELDYSHLMDRLTESIWMYKVYTNLYQMKSNGCWLGWQLAAKASLHVLDHNADEQISIILAIRERETGEFGGSCLNLEQCQQHGVSTCFRQSEQEAHRQWCAPIDNRQTR